MVNTRELEIIDRLSKVFDRKGIRIPEVIFIENSHYDFFSLSGTLYLSKEIPEFKIDLLLNTILKL